jgi:hypothetical protein
MLLNDVFFQHPCLELVFFNSSSKGVGKSSLTHLICRGQPIPSPSWTIGASLDVKVHVFKDGTPQQKKYFVELWDVGGCNAHSNTRCVFYNNVNGELTSELSILV